jgi:hypothetical protein
VSYINRPQSRTTRQSTQRGSCEIRRDRTNLVPESMQELDSIDEQEDADASFLGLEILEDVLGEEIDDVDEDVGRGDSMLS